MNDGSSVRAAEMECAIEWSSSANVSYVVVLSDCLGAVQSIEK